MPKPAKKESLEKDAALQSALAVLQELVAPYKDSNQQFGAGYEWMQRLKRLTLDDPKYRTSESVAAMLAWKAVCESAHSRDSAVAVFLGLPDCLTNQSYAGLSGGFRLTHPDIQKERYERLAGFANELLDATRGENLHRLLADQANEWGEKDRLPRSKCAEATIEHSKTAARILEDPHAAPLRLTSSLMWLRELLLGANPHRWHASLNVYAPDVAKQAFTAQVAHLNRHLKTPQHSALATLANQNAKKYAPQISSDAVRKAWVNWLNSTGEGAAYKAEFTRTARTKSTKKTLDLVRA
jgi:hypothetical protein